MKRPLACTSVVFVMVLLLLYGFDTELLRHDPVITMTDGEKNLYGFSENEQITICGTVRDYSYNDRYEQITTELVLNQVYLISKKNSNSKEKTPKQITKSGQSIIVYCNDKKEPVIGSQVIVKGNLAFWKPAANPGEFDAEKFYTNRDTLFAVKKAEFAKTGTKKNVILQVLKEFRLKQEACLEDYLPKDNAAVMKAMLFGNKKEIDRDMKTMYQNNGIAHVLAISGLHISLIGMSVYRLLLYLPLNRRIVLFLSESFLLLYGCMVGFSASSFRAVFMFTFFLLAKVLKRSYDMITAMAFSAMIQLLFHPGYIYDCGFQLSYGSIIGIAILFPALEQWSELIKNKYIRKVVVVFFPSLSVTLVTAPVLIFHYYELSFFSIILNFIVLPLMGPLLLAGILLLIMVSIGDAVGMWIITAAGGMVSFVINGILWIFEIGCRILEWFPIGRKNIAPLSAVELVLYYGLLFGMTVVVKQKQQWYQFLLITIAVCIFLIPGKVDFAVWMLDVGQGDCNVIFTDEGKCFVIDCGSTSKYNVGEKILIPFLKYHGVGTVEAVFVSHPDEDHMNGIVELVEAAEDENIRIGWIGIWDGAIKEFGENESSWMELAQAVRQKKIPVIGIAQGDSIRAGDVTWECLYPLKEQKQLEGNEASLVLSMVRDTKERFSILYTGDLETAGEIMIMEEYGMEHLERYDVLKVGHHGSSGSSSELFLNSISPKTAVISAGKNNVYGHPHEETIARLKEVNAQILQVSESGAVCMKPGKKIRDGRSIP